MRPIDADALDNKLDELMKRYAAQGRKAVAEDYNFVRTVLMTAPTLTLDDIVPHGRWEEYPDSAHLRCTHCKIEFKKEKMTDTKNYCPNCGAKMDLEEE